MRNIEINLNVSPKELTGRGSFQLIQSRANFMSRAGAASAEYYSTSRIPLELEHDVVVN